DKTNITRQKDGVFFRAEAYGFSPEFMDYVRNLPIQPDRGSAFGRALLEGRAVHIPDVKADPEYTLVEGQKLGDYRTTLAVPMLREGVVIGVFSLTRSEVCPFSEKQIELARLLPIRQQSQSRTCACLKAWRRARANWPRHSRICAPLRIVWSGPN